MNVRVKRPSVVVVGTGMAAARFVEELLHVAPERFEIRMFGAEPHGTYNRILLSHVLGGDHDPSQLWTNSLNWYHERQVKVHAGIRVEKIDLEKREAVGTRNIVEPYDYLVLATGSRPFVPPMTGANQKGVFVFRTLEDCTEIAGYAAECDRAIVLGGGLLGLEAAKGLLAHGVEVTVIEVAPYLMGAQLDPVGGALLKKKMQDMGVHVRTGLGVSELVGEDGKVCGVKFQDGSILETDMVVISCGIRPNVELAKESGVQVERAIVVDDSLRTSNPSVFAIGECAQHQGRVYGLVEPVWEMAKVAAHTLANHNQSKYTGSRLGTTLKVMGIDLTSMGDVNPTSPDVEIVTHLDPKKGIYKKFVLKDGYLEGAILLGQSDDGGMLLNAFKAREKLDQSALELLTASEEVGADPKAIPDSQRICNCNDVSKGKIVLAIQSGACSVGDVGKVCKAGTGCGSCQSTVAKLIEAYAPEGSTKAPKPKNKIEVMKEELDGLDAQPRLLELAETNNWKGMTEDDKQRAKWSGLFFRKPTPGHFMMRVRFIGGRTNALQFRTLADLGDEFGKGFCDLTTRQQLQLRWFTLGDTPEIWNRLEAVGLSSVQTGMDSIRGISSCAISGFNPNEAFDPTDVCEEFDKAILHNKAYTNLPRKLNIVITGCLENCTHAETQDISLLPAEREGVAGFNVYIGGKQGSGGYRPSTPLDVWVPLELGAKITLEITNVFREYGPRELRTRARLYFLLEDKGIRWYRAEIEKRMGQKLPRAGADLRKTDMHADHIGIHPQKLVIGEEQKFYAGLLVPAGRITTVQMRAIADLAQRYGNGDLRMTVGQNVIVPHIPESRLGEFKLEPILQELSFDPSPIMRGLVVCTGNDYCHQALIDTKAYALSVARELEHRTKGRKVLPLSIHWSGCPSSCGLHQVSTIGLQGCRSRVNNQVVDAAHVYINGKTGPQPKIATDLMYDVPCEKLADALEPLVLHLPRG